MYNVSSTEQSGKASRVGQSESRVGDPRGTAFSVPFYLGVYQLLSYATFLSHNYYSFYFLHLSEKLNTLNAAFPRSDEVLDGFGEP